MLYFDRIDVSEGIDINKASVSKECDICHYCYFIDNGFKWIFQTFVWSECYDVFMLSMSLSGIVILNTNGADYCCTINGISKSETIYLMQGIDLNEKNRTL